MEKIIIVNENNELSESLLYVLNDLFPESDIEIVTSEAQLHAYRRRAARNDNKS